MTWGQGVGVLLIVLGLGYALLYVGWLRRARKKASAAGMLSGTTAVTAGPGPKRTVTVEPPRALTLAWAQGTYLGTTTAGPHLELAAEADLGAQSRGIMVVDENSVRWEREGTADVRVAGNRLIGVSLEGGMAGKLMGQASIVLVSWHADNGKSGDRFATGFLPRRRADSATLVSALQRLKRIGAS